MQRTRSNKDQDGLYQRADSAYWWATFTDASGHRTRRSTGTGDRKEAEALLAKWRLETYRAKQWDEPPEPTFDQLMLEYLDGPSKAKRSSERDRYSAKQLYQTFTGMGVRSITPADVRGYIKKRQAAGVEPGTINRELGLLSAALNWARLELEWTVNNPVSGRRLREPAGRIRWLTRDQAEALIKAAQVPHLADFIRLGLNTGMRAGEMLGLEWRRVDLKTGLLYLEADDQKNGKMGSVPLNRDASTAILSRARFRATNCPASPWVFCHPNGTRIQAIKRSFSTACRLAGIEDFHPHDMRHTCAAWLVQAGAQIREVCELLRHSDIRMTMRYAHLSPENVRSAVERLDTPPSRLRHGGNFDGARNAG